MTFNLKGYTIIEPIHSSKNSRIFKGFRFSDNKAVVIKYLNKEFPSSDELARFTREYHIIRNISGDGIIRAYGLEKYMNSLVMITEDFSGDSLATKVLEHKPDYDQKMNLAIRLADALGQIHQQSIIHKDINPSNIIWNPGTDQIKIIDFGISTELSRENPESRHPNILEGTLAYISPEQTGRMNRSIDYRTDLYSLGITLYELFTGELPFHASDAMGLVHCHIAAMPKAPHQVNSEIPEAISEIIMKLLAKTAEDRYQSTLGLKKDLEFCREHIADRDALRRFSPGLHDTSGRFQIPQKLYGRKEDLETLLSAFDRVSSGSKEIMLVAGYSGIGKSALVHEVNKPIVGRRGHFISGKFDQFKLDIPYSALIQAFQELVKNLLAEHEERLYAWKLKLIEALGPSGQIVIDVIPEIELIIGKQPPVQELDPDQARNRFNIVFQNFIRVFADKDHPLALFIDDLQWADLPSIHLIEQFMTDVETRYLLIIGSYRDNEVNPSHPLMMTLNNLKKNGATIHTITLKPLDPLHVNHLIADAMFCDQERSGPLSHLCFEKTMGNPFFLYQLLYSLYEDGTLAFDSGKGVWDFDIDRIREADITENVVDLMVGKIRKLSPDIQETLKLAACIGNSFDLTTLSLLSGRSKKETAALLFEALKERLLIPLDDRYKFITDDQEAMNVGYRFLHDRILQAAYSLTSEETRKNIHLKIGRLLLTHVSPDERTDILFDIVNHYNLGSELITDPNEKDKLARLNLQAGTKARQSAAYKPSCDYLNVGIRLLNQDGWKYNYPLMLALHTEAMESAYLSTKYAESDHLYTLILDNSKTVLDKVKASDIKILSLLSKSDFKEAMNTGLDLLRQIKVKMPESPKKFHIIVGLIKIKLLLRKFSDDMIMASHAMTDPMAIARSSILHKLTSIALFSDPELYPLIIFKRIELALKYGKEPLYSLSAFTSLGLILCSLGHIEEGNRYGTLAESLLTNSSMKKEKTRILVVVNVFIRHWKDHLRDTIKPLLTAYESRIETGDIEYASHGVTTYCMHIFISGMDLKTVEQEQAKFIKSIGLLRQKFDVDNISLFHQTTLNLMDPEKSLTDFSGSSFNEKEMVPVLLKEGNKTALFIYYLYKLYLYYLAGEYDQAYAQVDHVYDYLISLRASVLVPFFSLCESMTHLALCDKSSKKERIKHLEKVARNQKTMEKWANHAPMNYRHKWHLVEAEKAAVLGQPETAKAHYNLAIKGAKDNEYIMDEALANERYALLVLSQGEEDIAGFIMRRARYCYELWGADAKVALLEKKYPHLLRHIEGGTPKMTVNVKAGELFTTGTKTANSEILDMASLMKASRMISREIVLSKLIEKMLKITMENVGAQKGFVILEHGGKYFIEGEAVLGKEGIRVLQSIPVENHPGLSSAIVNYVARTKKVLILDDAANEGDFTDDPYVIKNKPKSILCNVISNQGKITAIMYVENNLSKAAFQLERMDLLGALGSQAAISITNARLYESLEEKVRERTAELNLTLKEVEAANEKIISSIRYAGIIQYAMLPEPSAISSFLPNSFFIWEPRDIVGGDIYVCEKLDTGIIVALIDCTGHGVPGAFMTMLASSGMRRIIREERLFRPSDILKRMNYLMKSSLQQDKENPRSDDGLDAAVCYFDENEKTLYFSGARIPLFYIDQGELHIVKGDRQSIGYVSSDLSYEFSTVSIDNKDLSKTFYLATDGFVDQHGGEEKQRFTNKGLHTLLIENYQLPFAEQSQVLIDALERHRGNTQRTDDVTVAGFKF